MKIAMAQWPEKNGRGPVSRFLARPAFDETAEDAACAILDDVRRRGDAAVVKYAREFDGANLRAADLRVSEAEFAAARKSVDAGFLKAARGAAGRIRRFSRAGLRKNWSMPTGHGGRMGEQFVPLDRVGAYVPGGEAPLVSTALMTVTLADVAGVSEIVACTPCDEEGRLPPEMLVALQLAGATEVYRVGGIHAVGMMAFGTRRVPKVQKIVGPGGTFVTAAKRQVYGYVALDLVAGPSEIAILADDSADVSYVAADLLSQAEHGTGWEKTLLVTPSKALARAAQKALVRQASTLARRKAVERVLRRGTLIVTVRDLDEGMDLCNRFAPEHFELLVEQPTRWLKKVRAAGAVFLGPWTPESVGDFAAGPSHVLPTGGAAARFSGLTVGDFRRRSSFMRYTRADLKEALPIIEAFSAVEGLDGHGRSARIRFGNGDEA